MKKPEIWIGQSRGRRGRGLAGTGAAVILCAAVIFGAYFLGRWHALHETVEFMDVMSDYASVSEESYGPGEFYHTVCGQPDRWWWLVSQEQAARGEESAKRLRRALVEFCQHSKKECDYDETCV